jgi:Acetyltransferase (GNAT) domain
MKDLQKTPVIRPLPLHERHLLSSAPGTGSDEPAPNPEHSLVVVASAADRVVGTITAERVWMVSNLCVDVSARGSGTAEAMARMIAGMNHEGLTEMLCTTNRHVELLAHRFGFVPVNGTLFRR